MNLKVNVVNGNLVLETSQLHIHGTGIDLNIGAVYNGLPSASTVDMGAKWNLTVGTGIFLTVNSQTQAVTLHTSTGASVTYFPDSQSHSGYDEPPNVDATLFHNQDGSFTLVSQQNGECFGFNTSGQETYDEDKNTNLITFAYIGSQLNTITDTQNRVTSVSYDGNDRIKQITDPMDRTVQYLYKDGNNNLTDIVDAAGKTTHFVYSGHDLISITDPLLNVTTLTYQSGDLVGSEQDAFQDPATSFDYEPSGDSACSKISGSPCTVVTDPNGGLTTYYSTGLLVNDVYDPLGHKEKNTYTLDSHVTTYTDALGNLSQVNFDPNNNNTVSSLLDGNKAMTGLLYGDSNNPYSPTQATDPQLNTVAYGVTINYTYDTLDRLTKITYSKNGVKGTVSYGYDDNGNQTSVVDNTGTTTFKYDADNRLSKKTLPTGVIFTSTYDHIGNLKTLDDGGTDTLGTVTYGYDAANRMTTLTESGGTNITHYGYDDANRRTSISYPKTGGVQVGMQIGCDSAGHETSNTGGVLNGTGGFKTIYSSFQYSYNITSKTYSNLLQSVTQLDPLTWNTTKSYYTRSDTYDTMSRLTDVTVTNSNQVKVEDWSYSYDGNGNLTSATPGAALSYNNKNQTTAIGSNTYSYSGATQADLVQTNGDTFNYSGLGVSRETDSSGTTSYIRCSCGLLNSERTPDGKTHYYLFDNLDSVVGLTESSTGNKDNSYDYDPYGQVKAQQEGEDNPWKFASGFYDSSTNLYHFGARYYDPSLGRWTQQDAVAGSLGDLGAANRYVYAGDDPVNLVDPSGGTDCATSLWVNGLQIIGELALIAKGAWWIAGAIGALEATDAAELAAGGPIGFLVAIGQTIAFIGAFFGAVTVIKYYGNIIAQDCGLPISF